MSAPILDVRNLTFTVGRKTILDRITFSVNEGDYVSVIGPNGAGKTSLIRCLNRINRIASGTISVAGTPLHELDQRELARIMSYVPQADGRDAPFSVYDFVLMGRYPHRSALSGLRREDHDAVEAALASTHIEALAERSLATLSGGEQQKVFIAAALAQEAKILLLDEPTTFLDYRHQVEVRALLHRLNREQGITIIAVTHDADAAVFSSHRVLALKHGALIFDGTPDALLDPEVLENIYDTAFRIVRDGASNAPIVVPEGPAS